MFLYTFERIVTLLYGLIRLFTVLISQISSPAPPKEDIFILFKNSSHDFKEHIDKLPNETCIIRQFKNNDWELSTV